MRQPFSLGALASSVLLLPAAVNALSYDCGNLREGGVTFNFEDLKGPRFVYDVRKASVGHTNTTYSLDICDRLQRPKDVDKKHYCPDGTRICAITEHVDGDQTLIESVLPIARNSELTDGARLEPKLERLKDSSSNEDSKKEGLRVELHGGKSMDDKKKQRAIIEFLCKPEDKEKGERRVRRDDGDEKDGDKKEGDKEGDDKKGDDKDGDKKGDGDADDEDDRKDEWAKLRKTDDGKGGELEFLSYDTDDKFGTLRMNWHTKYACEGFEGHEGSGSGPRGGWGFFSWFFFLLFLGIVAYFGFFAWVNYSKYGAQGWDLLPHSDTIRDIPYILADWGRKVVATFTGGSSRGGYSAV